MTEIIDDISESLDELLNEPADSTEKLKLLELVKNGLIRKYCGKNLTEDKINKLSNEEIDQYHKIYLEKYNNELRKPIANSILNIYAHTVNRFKKIDSVDKLTDDLVNDPAINAAFDKIPNEFISSLSLILAPIMLVSHTYNHMECEDVTDNENSNDGH